ncbi:FAD-binding protein [Rhodococcus hoagii]|nr:FAD-binding protein [Prescottella equi]
MGGQCARRGWITIDLSQMRGVKIDVDARIARVEGGARLDDLMDAAGEHGLAAAVGTVNEVGVTGLTLGGGYGPYLGTIGLAADNIISADVVLADGSLARASADENADLLWALRGGGGNFGVVTSLEIGLSVLPEVLAGVIAFGTTEIEKSSPSSIGCFRAFRTSSPCAPRSRAARTAPRVAHGGAVER